MKTRIILMGASAGLLLMGTSAPAKEGLRTGSATGQAAETKTEKAPAKGVAPKKLDAKHEESWLAELIEKKKAGKLTPEEVQQFRHLAVMAEMMRQGHFHGDGFAGPGQRAPSHPLNPQFGHGFGPPPGGRFSGERGGGPAADSPRRHPGGPEEYARGGRGRDGGGPQGHFDERRMEKGGHRRMGPGGKNHPPSRAEQRDGVRGRGERQGGHGSNRLDGGGRDGFGDRPPMHQQRGSRFEDGRGKFAGGGRADHRESRRFDNQRRNGFGPGRGNQQRNRHHRDGAGKQGQSGRKGHHGKGHHPGHPADRKMDQGRHQGPGTGRNDHEKTGRPEHRDESRELGRHRPERHPPVPDVKGIGQPGSFGRENPPSPRQDPPPQQ